MFCQEGVRNFLQQGVDKRKTWRTGTYAGRRSAVIYFTKSNRPSRKMRLTPPFFGPPASRNYLPRAPVRSPKQKGGLRLLFPFIHLICLLRAVCLPPFLLFTSPNTDHKSKKEADASFLLSPVNNLLRTQNSKSVIPAPCGLRRACARNLSRA